MEHFSNKLFVEANMKASAGSKLKLADIGMNSGTPERMLEMILNDDSIPQNERKVYNDHYASFKSDMAERRVFSPTTKYLNKKNMNFHQQRIWVFHKVNEVIFQKTFLQENFFFRFFQSFNHKLFIISEKEKTWRFPTACFEIFHALWII